MGVIFLTVDDKVEKEFRTMAGLKYGFRKGSLGKAVDEAFRLFIKTNSHTEKVPKEEKKKEELEFPEEKEEELLLEEEIE